MKFNNDTLYIWVGGSCDYGHEERAGGGAYIAEIFEISHASSNMMRGSSNEKHRSTHEKRGTFHEQTGKIIDTYTCAEFGTTEFRMMLKSMIFAMEKFTGNTAQKISKIEFLSNVQYLLNFDKKPTTGDTTNADLIEQCITLKQNFDSVVVRVLPYHKFPRQKEVHDMASEAMRKLRNSKVQP